MKFPALLYPVWVVFFHPSAAWLILPGNFLIDSLVLIAAMHWLHLDGKAVIWKRSILRIFVAGFLADCLGAMLSFGLYAFLLPAGFPWEQLTMLPGIAFEGAMLYLFHSCFSFGRCELNHEQLHALCLSLATFTAPYTMLLPFALF